ncbi:MAG: ankyrin repeat domain-containing protein [Vulcanimicrobiota bacterium]
MRFISLFAVAVLLIVFLLCTGDDHLPGAAASSGIHDAIRSGDLARVKALLERYPRLISDIDGSSDPTLLHEAALSGNCDIVRFLLSKGMSVKCGDICERTPLHMAVDQAQKDLIELFIQKGADVNARSNDGFTPLRMEKRSEILRYEVKLARELTDILKRAGAHE